MVVTHDLESILKIGKSCIMLDRESQSIIARGDRGEIRWRLVWGPERASSVRGVNLMRVRDGRIIEAQGYVKGA